MIAALLAAATTLLPVVGKPGPVTIVDVFTVDCINCRDVVPELRRLRRAYGPADLAIVGVHAPETPAERNHAYALRGMRMLGITWPVVWDDRFAIWDAYGVQAWPTQLVFDRAGRLRATIVGEGEDDRLAATVRSLVGEQSAKPPSSVHRS